MIVEGMDVEKYKLSPQLVYLSYLTEKWSDIQEHLPRLRAAAKGNILEIGVRTGVSTSAFLTGVKINSGHVYSIDIEDCNVFDGDPDWTFVQLDSNNTGRMEAIRQLGQASFDVVLIDGDHSFNACLTDLKRYGILAPQIFVHDADMQTVREAIDRFMDEHQGEYSLTIHPGSYGLAELLRNATEIVGVAQVCS